MPVSPEKEKALVQFIETLSSKLGIGEFKIDNTGRKVLSFGADPFLKTSLTEKMGEFICIIAGYKDELENTFFRI